ncbi:MAG TPA: hypothetical protein DCE56_33895 [Cyanobacteria bacterium UBA8553]|nr:hypothetical protein [Cyanobacteria bacterium UBA8553]HAJ59685.1 hypothetical protein [Cyanobacteria bacterium UBA8543]
MLTGPLSKAIQANTFKLILNFSTVPGKPKNCFGNCVNFLLGSPGIQIEKVAKAASLPIFSQNFLIVVAF